MCTFELNSTTGQGFYQRPESMNLAVTNGIGLQVEIIEKQGGLFFAEEGKRRNAIRQGDHQV